MISNYSRGVQHGFIHKWVYISFRVDSMSLIKTINRRSINKILEVLLLPYNLVRTILSLLGWRIIYFPRFLILMWPYITWVLPVQYWQSIFLHITAVHVFTSQLHVTEHNDWTCFSPGRFVTPHHTTYYQWPSMSVVKQSPTIIRFSKCALLVHVIKTKRQRHLYFVGVIVKWLHPYCCSTWYHVISLAMLCSLQNVDIFLV